MPLGAGEASVIAIAERLKLTDVATLDRRHFTVVRPKHAKALNLPPKCWKPGQQVHNVSRQPTLRVPSALSAQIDRSVTRPRRRRDGDQSG
jgi:hypothetical protein